MGGGGFGCRIQVAVAGVMRCCPDDKNIRSGKGERVYDVGSNSSDGENHVEL